MEEQLTQLKTRLARIADLGGATGLLAWERETYMPQGGAQARADQLGTLGGLAHEFFVDEEMGQLLEGLVKQADQLDFASDEASLIRVKWREYEKAVKVPTELIMELISTASIATGAWREARKSNDFKLFQPHLEKIVDINIRIAEALGYPSGNPYDALLDNFEPGLSYEYINRVFAELKPHLVQLIKDIRERGKPVDDSAMRGEFDEKAQIEFSRQIAASLGFEFHHGRLDLAAHPFTSSTSYQDVRLTTRILKDFLPSCLMSVIHEAGHGMHAQNMSPSLYRSTIEFPGLAIAESQSRFYENIVARSRSFWKYWFPQVQATFPALRPVDSDTFYRALNKVEPGLIRVEADEVTYGLHIMLRFELENEIINKKVKVADLPREWNDRMESYLGVRPPNDSDGVLQDIHWSQGAMGYFPDYLLGSVFASQLWVQMQKDNPNVVSEIENGKYENVLKWQREKVHWHGGKFTFPELAERITGGPLKWEPYMNYLKTKYGDIYGL